MGLMAAPISAQRNSSETNPTPTTEATRSQRSSKPKGEKMRGEGEWVFANYTSLDVLASFRMDMESESLAEVTVDYFADPDMVENNLDVYYEGSFRVPSPLGYCEGIEWYDPEPEMTMFAITCADGKYVNFAAGTDKHDVIDAMTMMQDGFVPEIEGYKEQ